MRKFFSLILALATVSTLSAQSLAAFKEQLAQPADGISGAAIVTVTEYGNAAAAIENAARNSARSRVKGYRVCIFFDNGQNARAYADVAEASFQNSYPDIRSYKVYDNPYFKVTVGNCLTEEEAVILRERIRNTFPKAFLKNEEISLNDLR
ncbi:MAG: SPOR domain-containing protein [Alistipes sp.]